VATVGLAILCMTLPAVTYLRRSTYGAVIPAVNISSAAVILACVGPAQNAVSRLLSLGVLRWIGRLSYSLYLWHLPVFFASRFGPVARLPLTIGIALSITLASASYYIVERPALRLKRHFEPLEMPSASATGS
jgi:peptidoglycan/LPS O-acetylase OafA/YrhL